MKVCKRSFGEIGISDTFPTVEFANWKYLCSFLVI